MLNKILRKSQKLQKLQGIYYKLKKKVKKLNSELSIEVKISIIMLTMVLVFGIYQGIVALFGNDGAENQEIEEPNSSQNYEDLQKKYLDEKVPVTEKPNDTNQVNPNKTDTENPKRPIAGLPKIIEFYAVCSECLTSKPILNEMQQEYNKNFTVEYLDNGAEKNFPTSAKYDVQALPTQIFLDGNGKEIYRHAGVFDTKKEITKILELLEIIEEVDTKEVTE